MARKPARIVRLRLDRADSAELDAEIRRGAADLDAITDGDRPYTSPEVEARIRAVTEQLLAPYLGLMRQEFVLRRIPIVLGSTPEVDAGWYQPMLPGVMLPQYFAVMRKPLAADATEEEIAASVAGWKRDYQTTRRELHDMVVHREKVTAGYSAETAKYVLLRETAIERGCGEDEKIGSVLRDLGRRGGPGDGPHAPAPL